MIPTSAACRLFLLAALGAAAKETNSVPPHKSGYHLFNPTPGVYVRELNADRSGKTDCPFTVDAGYFQLEMDLANLTTGLPNSQHGNVL